MRSTYFTYCLSLTQQPCEELLYVKTEGLKR